MAHWNTIHDPSEVLDTKVSLKHRGCCANQWPCHILRLFLHLHKVSHTFHSKGIRQPRTKFDYEPGFLQGRPFGFFCGLCERTSSCWLFLWALWKPTKAKKRATGRSLFPLERLDREPSLTLFPFFRVAVVGAGISGLTAAYNLQKLGYEVTVFEADDRVGGKVESIYLPNGIPTDGFVVENDKVEEKAQELCGNERPTDLGAVCTFDRGSSCRKHD